MILATTSQSITVVLGEAKTTNDCDITAAYSDVTSSTYQDGANDTTTNGTSSVTLVAAPASSTARRVRELSLYNNDTVSHTVTFKYVDGANSRIIWSGTVVAKQLIFFGAENGWTTGQGVVLGALGILQPSNGGTGLATLTTHGVMLGEGTSPVSFATIGTAGRLLIDQGAGADPAFEVVSGDATCSSAGAVTVTKTNGTAFGALATLGVGTGVASAGGNLNASFANPSASVGLSTVNGSATTAMRSDGAPALSQAIVPTWTGTHTFNGESNSALFTGGFVGINTASPGTILDVKVTTNTHVGIRAGVNSYAQILGMIDLATGFAPLTLDGSSLLLQAQSGGYVGIGTTGPASLLDVYGAISISGTPAILANRTIAPAAFTVATLPTPVAGLRATVTDSVVAASGNFGVAPTGSGTHAVPVCCNETPAWLIG